MFLWSWNFKPFNPELQLLELKNIENENKTKYDTFYSHSKAEAIINGNDIDDIFVISNIQKSLGK